LRLSRWNPIVRHFNRLGLIDRYNELGNDELSEAFGNARDFLDNGGPRNRVRRFIRSGATRFSNVHGPSYWRAELRRQVAAAPELLAWLTENETDGLSRPRSDATSRQLRIGREVAEKWDG
jgi:hypothetical protein